MNTPFTPIPDVIKAIGEGRTVILVDDESRENEGDFIFAAELSTPEKINFMATHGRGAFGDLLFGSHTKAVMARTKVPLLVLH